MLGNDGEKGKEKKGKASKLSFLFFFYFLSIESIKSMRAREGELQRTEFQPVAAFFAHQNVTLIHMKCNPDSHKM